MENAGLIKTIPHETGTTIYQQASMGSSSFYATCQTFFVLLAGSFKGYLTKVQEEELLENFFK